MSSDDSITGPIIPYVTPADPSGTLPSGSTVTPTPALGDYELLGVLGQGGMGTVYKAHQRAAGRLVALKVVRPDRLEGLTAAQRASWLERFRTEARAAARIDHDHAVAVYEVGETEGRPFYSMRYVDGRSLADLLGDGPLPAARAAALLEPIARAVHAAHQKGILHRDLKPANVLLDASGRPYVTDFGLAKLLEEGAAQTDTGAVLGTPSYMAPEQASGRSRETTAASDVYALGAILYEMLTGRPPFRGTTPLDTLEQVRSREPVLPSQLQARVPRDLETVCLKCLEKEPRRRYAGAAELADELGRFVRHEPVRARPVGPLGRLTRWARRAPVLAASLAATGFLFVAALAVAVSFALYYREATAVRGNLLEKEKAARRSEGRMTALLAREKAMDLLDRREAPAALLWVARALEAAPPDDAELGRLLHLNLAEARRRTPLLVDRRQLPGPPAAVRPERARALVREPGPAGGETVLRLWDLNASAPIGRPLPLPTKGRFELADDGRTVVVIDPWREVRLHDLEDPNRESLLLNLRRFAPGRFTLAPELVTVLVAPDRRRAVVCHFPRDTHRLWDLTTGEPVGEPLPITVRNSEYRHWGRSLLFTPDSASLITLGPPSPKGESQVHVWDAATARPRGEPWVLPGTVTAFLATPDGRGLVTTDQSPDAVRLWDLTRPDEPARVLLRRSVFAMYRPVAFSPDGGLLVLRRTDRGGDASGGFEVIEVPAGKSRFRSGILTATEAGFSPDGRTLAVWGARYANEGFALWDAASGLPRGDASVPPGPLAGAWFGPDGQTLATLEVSGRQTVRRLPQATGQTPLADGDAGWLTFSPDGSVLKGQTREQGHGLWDAATGRRLELPGWKDDDVTYAAFNPDGSRLVSGQRGGACRLWDLAGRRLAADLPAHGPDAPVGAFSADGRTVLTAGRDGRVRRCDAATGRERGEPLVFDPPVAGLLVARQGSLVVFRAGRWARLYDAETGQPAGPRVEHDVTAWSGLVLPDGVAPGLNQTVGLGPDKLPRPLTLVDLVSGRAVGEPLAHPALVDQAVFSADGRTLATVARDYEVRLWDTTTGALRASLPHADRVAAVLFHPDGRALFTASGRLVTRWDTADGHKLGEPMRHDGAVNSLAYRPADDTLLAAAFREVVLWQTRTGLALLRRPAAPGVVNYAQVSRDWRRLVVQGNGTAHLWELPALDAGEPLDAARVTRWAQAATGMELDEDGATRLLDVETWRSRGGGREDPAVLPP